MSCQCREYDTAILQLCSALSAHCGKHTLTRICSASVLSPECRISGIENGEAGW